MKDDFDSFEGLQSFETEGIEEAPANNASSFHHLD